MKLKNIRSKLTALLLSLALVAAVLMGISGGVGVGLLSNYSRSAVTRIGNEAERNSVETITAQTTEELRTLADNKARIADSMLLLAQNQTLLVASAMEDVLGNAEYYLKGYQDTALPDLASANNGENIGKYSLHVRAPENLLKDIVKNDDGVVIDAKIDYSIPLPSGFTIKEELYLTSLIRTQIAQIKTFVGKDGGLTGFSASYFCFADSGLDVLGDMETQPMVAYDGRTRTWYSEVAKAVERGDMQSGDVFWTAPVQDGSGRGISMICAAPVIVNGKLVGVSGSGGTLTDFANLIQSAKLGDTGYSFVIGRKSSLVVTNPNGLTTSETATENNLAKSENAELKALAERIGTEAEGITTLTVDGEDMIAAFSALENNDWSMVTMISVSDDLIVGPSNALRDKILTLMEESIARSNTIITTVICTFGALFIAIVLAVFFFANKYSKKFTHPILQLQEGAHRISSGDLDVRMSIGTGDEIEELGNLFNNMAISLKEYIKNVAVVTAEKERIGAELNVATQIQASMLPCIFPAFPERNEFDIFASMHPAKEVGGDFYDFFFVDPDKLAVVIADVSGKGVPAALFMVIAKTLIKNHAQMGKSVEQVFNETNAQLCEGNDAGLFVTAWMGVLEISTGKFTYCNAGHNPPLIRKKNGTYEYMRNRAGFVLAGMEGIQYKRFETTLEKGDQLFLYTDGVTEATNGRNELLGEELLLETLNACKSGKPDEVIEAVNQSINNFVEGEQQFDDITMLSLKIL